MNAGAAARARAAKGAVARRGMRRSVGTRCSQRGATTVEAILLLGLFFLLVLGLADVSRYFLYQYGLATLSSEASRLVMVQIMGGTSYNNISGTCSTNSTIAQNVASSAPFLDISKLTLCLTVGTNTAVSPATTIVSISVSYPFQFILKVIGDRMTLTSAAGVQF